MLFINCLYHFLCFEINGKHGCVIIIHFIEFMAKGLNLLVKEYYKEVV